MAIYVYMCVFVVSLFLGAEGMIPGKIAAILSGFGLIMVLVCAFGKPKYKEKELVCWCELLPIINDVYAIKTDKDKYICKYIDGEDENKVKIDVLRRETEILTMTEGEKPMLFLFETKAKNAWLLAGEYTMYNVVLSIPENSVLE